MILSSSQIEQFRGLGFTTLPDLFTKREIQAMRVELNRFKQKGLLNNVATDGDGKTASCEKMNLQICPITPKSHFYRAIQFHPRVVASISQLIGEPFVFYLDQIFLKPGKYGVGTDWHQDNSYFKVSDPTKGTAMWVALHDATLENGTLHVIPESHKEAFPHDRDPGSNHHIHCQVPEERAVPIKLSAGGAAFFNFGIAHSTQTNNTNHERAGLALHFLRTDYIPPNPERAFFTTHIVGPLASGGLNEYGVLVEESWENEVDRLLVEAIDS